MVERHPPGGAAAGRGLSLRRRALLALPALLPAAARAQGAGGAWRPGQQVRIIVPAAAGGTTDIMGRLCAQHLQARWGTPVVVENRTGAGGTIGTLEVVRARPDGTTLLSGNIGPQAIAYSLFRNLPYRAEQLAPIAGQIRGPNVLVVNASTPVRNMAEFVAWLRGNPGKVSYASTGVGQSTHLTPVWLLQLLKAEAIHVPFRGSAPAQVELLAGNVGFLIDNLTGVIEHIHAGRLRALAVTSAERNAELPEVPAAKETLPELREFEVNTWFGLFGPAGLPHEVIRSLNADINALLDLPETQQRFAQLGGVPLKLSPEGFADWVRAETEKWAAVIKREGLQLDAG
ncbi:tripartite tricarboxylate transporter substrate binding protein [Siccirubricoccus sp. KC 17139]|uniref:Tripartite tricarboxylate transporter substrate binding protein n=1 Tax=Siccirubricoccus soli TaxID=2899147 RepID=A0ABT1DDH5_9PROT|nr:tripartite tricarboxylate transporter substrate binding protein [Siccirubricoccus soli]MCO6419977.1 tripartite tricarboxylate transporter substrate binding protein [Siccirubricoccus soli]MCP2686112.1 tripartite tricarboxylate transporter substrate binding protein [Siccirubricoccus soli]